MTIELSIIIVNFNTSELTIDCIESIKLKTSLPAYEIIVVDNASASNDLRNLKNGIKGVTIIENHVNIGFGGANNIGIEKATGRYILLINSDTRVLGKAIDKCYGFMESEFARINNIGLCGIKLVNEDGSIQKSVFHKGSIWGFLINGNPIISKLHTAVANRGKFNYAKSQFVDGISGAFMFFRSEVFNRVRGFDPDIFMYSEETELCRNRVGKHYKIYYWIEATIIHYGGGSDNSDNMFYQNMASYALTWYKKGYIKYLLYLIISFLNFLSFALVFPFSLNRKWISKNLNGYRKIFRYLIFEIPKYGRGWGARPKPLIIE